MRSVLNLIATISLLCPVLSSASTQNDESIKVQVHLNDHIRRYTYSPKLSDVLAPVALQRDWFWPASALYKQQDQAAEQERNEVLAQLKLLTADGNGALSQALSRTSYFISSWSLATRLNVAIDYDLVRIRPQQNLGFDDGHYMLKLYPRPQNIEFWGAVDQVVSMPHSGVKTVAAYLPALNRSAYADMSYVLIIQPDGEIKRAGVESWNAQHIELMPGSSVFIPFASSLFQDLTPLNEAIARLARHRVK